MAERDEIETAQGGRDVAVVGLSGRFPGARDLRAFWRNLAAGVEAVTFPSDDALRAAGVAERHLRAPRYVKAASLLEGVDRFDAGFFGYSAREAALLDPQQRLFLEHAVEALEDAGHTPAGFDGLIGVYAGVAWNTYLLSNLTTRPELFEGGGGFQVFIASDKDFMPTRVAYKLDLKGPAMSVQTSCSTSLVAIHLACLSLLNYECDLALAGGVTVKVPQVEGYYHEEGGLASPDGHCRAFDARAAGTLFGSGVGVVALRRLADARAAGDHIHAVVKASAVNNDGAAKVSFTAPSVPGQVQVIASAQALAGIDPATLACVETHGTGTSLGDPIEVTALTQAFRASTAKRGFCALGSVKTNVGHLDAAAGVAGFIKTVLALEHGQIPPSLNFETPNPAIDFESSPFYVNTVLRDWPATPGPRRAAVSSFGVGGTNAHVILEQAPPRAPSGASRPWQPLLLSARSAEALEAATLRLRDALDEPRLADVPLADVAFTLACGRNVFRHRRALVARDRDEALAALSGSGGPRLLTVQDADDPRARPVAFLFPGQGAQHPGMARDVDAHEPVFRGELRRCAEVLRARAGLDLLATLFAPPEAEAAAAARLQATELAQPALFAVEYALAQQWRAWGVVPRAMLGHSLGEYVAACLAGVMTLEDALGLVAARGRLMQQQPAGAMLAVSLGEAELQPLLGAELSCAAFNAPGSAVVSGPPAPVAALERTLGERGVETRRLHTSHAFHSAMMAPVEEPFRHELRRVHLRPPEIPFVSNVSGTWIRPDEATDPEYWVRHLRAPVRFEAGLRALFEDPERVLLEVGPGRTLTTLAGRHPQRREQPLVASLRHPREEGSDEAALIEACARLWLHGVRFDWAGFYADERRARVPLPTYPFERQRYWIDPVDRAGSGAPPPAGALVKADPSQWLYLPSWRRTPPPAPAPATSGDGARTLLVFADAAGLAEAVAERWRTAGGRCAIVTPGPAFAAHDDGRYVLDPARVDDYAALLAALNRAGHRPAAILHAWGLGLELPAGAAAAFDAARAEGFDSLLALLRALAPDETPVELLVVADGALALLASETLEPARAMLGALVRSAAWELPHVAARLVDLRLPQPGASGAEQQAQALLDALHAELGATSGETLVAWRGDERWVPAFERVPPGDGAAAGPDAAPAPLRPRGVYLVTGGLARDGYGVARALARHAQARLVLVDDGALGALPANERTARVERCRAALEALGAEVLVAAGDAGAPGVLARAVAEAEQRFGALHGVVHAAQAPEEGTYLPLEAAPRAAFDAHFAAKVHALHALDAALGGRQLDFVLLWSSLASVIGGVGAGAFAAANLYLEAYARERRRGGARSWRSLAFDLWRVDDEAAPASDGGAATLARGLTQVDGELAALALGPTEGEDAFVRALSVTRVERLLVSTGALDARLEHVRVRAVRRRLRAAAHPAGEAGLHPRPSLPNPYAAPESDLERRIAEVWQRALGFAPVGVEDNFFELGGDSLLAVRVIARLKDELGLDLPVAQLYQGLTVRALARALDESQAQAEARASRLGERRDAAARRRDFIERRRARRAESASGEE